MVFPVIGFGGNELHAHGNLFGLAFESFDTEKGVCKEESKKPIINFKKKNSSE